MKCYKIEHDDRSQLAEWEDDAIDIESIFCQLVDGHQRASERFNDLTIVLDHNRIPDVFKTWYSEWIISQSVADLFKNAGFTGYELKPVTVSRIKRGNRDITLLSPLWELRHIGWGGVAPPASGMKLLEECEGCGHMVYSALKNPTKLFDETQWDGSDFFMIWPLPNFIFVTERVRELVLANNLSGCVFVPIEELPHGPKHNPLGTVSPGRLRQSLPDKRAREIGEPLGIY
jgi:hypothetical protein